MAPVRLSVTTAARAAASTGVPLLLAYLLRRPEIFWMATGGFLGALVDRSGGYRTRAINFGAVAAAMGIAGGLAALLGESWSLAVVGMLAWGTAVSFLRVYGVAGANVGLTSSVIFAISLASPLPPAAALERGGWVLAGGGWAGLLALILWPLRPLQPVRLSLARCFRSVALYAAEIEALVERGGGEHGAAGRSFDSVRRALEEAWTALGSGWSRWPSRSRARDRLLVLIESADQMLGLLVALSDLAERLPDRAERTRVRTELRRLSLHTEQMARALEREPGLVDLPEAAPAAPRSRSAGEPSDPSLPQTERLLRTLRDLTETTREVLSGAHRPAGRVPAPGDDRSEPQGWLDPIRANLCTDSILLRHAVRVGITSAVAVLAARLLELELGHWITLTVVFVLQPNVGATLVKAAQRVAGTVLGALAAAVLPLLVHSPAFLLTLLSGLAAAAVVSLRVNYTLFTFFVTPTFVLLSELQTGTPGLATTRVVNTLIGGVLAIAGTRLLWSLPERRRFPAHAAAALHTTRGFLTAALDNPHTTADARKVAALRRKLGLEVINADESLHRMAIEGGRAAERIEAGRTILVYLRRLTSASVSLAMSPAPSPAEAEMIRHFAAGAARALAGIAEAIAAGRGPPALSPLVESEWPRPLRADLERIERPIRMLHAAAERLPGW